MVLKSTTASAPTLTDPLPLCKLCGANVGNGPGTILPDGLHTLPHFGSQPRHGNYFDANVSSENILSLRFHDVKNARILIDKFILWMLTLLI